MASLPHALWAKQAGVDSSTQVARRERPTMASEDYAVVRLFHERRDLREGCGLSSGPVAHVLRHVIGSLGGNRLDVCPTLHILFGMRGPDDQSVGNWVEFPGNSGQVVNVTMRQAGANWPAQS